MPVDQEVSADVLARVAPKALAADRVVEQRPDGLTEPAQVTRIVEQHAGLAIRHLVPDPTHRGCDHRARLPHRFGHREPEALLNALLHHDRGVALKRVDDGRVLIDVRHGKTGQLHPCAPLVRQRAPGLGDLVEDCGTFGIVGDPADVGSCQHEVRLRAVACVLGEAEHHTDRVLEAVPPRDLGDERHVRARRRPGADDVAMPVHPARAAVIAGERRRHVLRHAGDQQPDMPEDR